MKKWLLILVIVLIVLGSLFYWGRISNPALKAPENLQALGINCLPSHANALQHIHSQLTIFINGQQQVVPADIGITPNCMAEIHTHDQTGKIHIETIKAGKQFFLQTFFAVWQTELIKKDYQLSMNVNGQLSEEFGKLVLKDDQQIILKYISNSTTTAP